MLPNLRVPQHIMPLTDDELFELCASNSELVIERNSNGELIIMSPTGGLTGNRSSRLLIEVGKWNDKKKLGYVFDSSTGFLLGDGSMLSPDTSWISKERWDLISRDKQEKFPPICPDFIIELRSPSDEFKYVKNKMNVWIKNGCRLAWFIDPIEKIALVYRPQQTVREYSFTEKLIGEDVLPGFELALSKLK
jgi:Uma2 family endonuclease